VLERGSPFAFAMPSGTSRSIFANSSDELPRAPSPSGHRSLDLSRGSILRSTPAKSEAGRHSLDLDGMKDLIKQQQAVCEALLPLKVKS
jgi:hypothetical protein